MAVEDIILRSVINAPLTTKGSQLTWEELDGNFIEIFNAFLANYLSSYVDAYSNAITYDNSIKNYVVYDSVIWKFVNVTPAVNVTPGTDAATWTRVFAADLAHKKNSDTILAEGTADEVTAAALAAFINGNSQLIFSGSTILPSANVLTLFSAPVPLITHAGGIYAGKSIKILNMEVRNDIQASPPSTPYATSTSIVAITNGATKSQFSSSSILNAKVNRSLNSTMQSGVGSTDTQLVPDEDVYVQANTADPTAGDYDVVVTYNYIYI